MIIRFRYLFSALLLVLINIGAITPSSAGTISAGHLDTSSKAHNVGSSASLSTVLHRIAAHSPDVLAARAAESQTEAQVQLARAAWFGKVDAYALSQHYNDPRLTRAITQPPNVALYPFGRNQFGYGIDAQLPIDISGKIAAEVDAARAHSNSARWSAEDVLLRALLQGATAYRNLQSLIGQKQALGKQIEALKKSERVAKAGLAVGNIAKVNLLRVEASLASLNAQMAGIDGQIQKFRSQLAALIGVDRFDAPIELLVKGPSQIPRASKNPPPSILLAMSNVESAQDKVKAAQRAQYPQLSINGGWNRNAVQWNQQPVSTWQVSLGVKLNLWSGGAQKSAIDAAQASQLESSYRLSAAEKNLRAARDGALALWKAQEAAWRAAESGLRAAAESARIEQDRFKNGLGSATDLIDAESALASARANVANALAGWWQADDSLRYAYGEPPAAFRDVHSKFSSTTP